MRKASKDWWVLDLSQEKRGGEKSTKGEPDIAGERKRVATGSIEQQGTSGGAVNLSIKKEDRSKSHVCQLERKWNEERKGQLKEKKAGETII